MSDTFTIRDFENRYPNDDACLTEVFNNRYHSNECPECHKITHFYRIKDRKCYACQFCGHQLHPLSNTIFHKSETPLKMWFYSIFLFAKSKNGVSAKELERQLGVTYKTAWRIAKQIRLLMSQIDKQLDGNIEIDETYIGGVRHGKRGRGAEGKTPVLGIMKRKGEVKAIVIENIKAKTVTPIILSAIKKDSIISTDEGTNYNKLAQHGFTHGRVKHCADEYVNGIHHTNTIEGFWSQLKRSIHGTYHAVSRKHLQSYVDEFAFRYSRRDVQTLFLEMIGLVVKPIL